MQLREFIDKLNICHKFFWMRSSCFFLGKAGIHDVKKTICFPTCGECTFPSILSDRAMKIRESIFTVCHHNVPQRRSRSRCSLYFIFFLCIYCDRALVLYIKSENDKDNFVACWRNNLGSGKMYERTTV